MPFQRTFALSSLFLPNTRALIRARVAICCGFFLQGFVFATWCARIPDIKAALLLNEAQLGTLLLMAPLGQFLTMVPNGLLVTNLGSRATAITAGLTYPLILVALAFAPNAWVLGAILFMMGVISNLSYTAINTQGVLLEKLYRRSIMSLFHGMWSIASAFAAFVAIGLAFLGVSLKAHLVGGAAACILLALFYGGALVAREHSPAASSHKRAWAFPIELVWLGLAAFGCMACEGTIYDWGGVYMREEAGTGAKLQNIGYFAYLCMMVLVRFVADKLTDLFGHRQLLILSGLVITLGYALTVITPNLPLVTLGMALIGAGTSTVVPLCCSLAGKHPTVAPGIAITEISTIGAFGFLISPPLVGYVAHALNLRVAVALMMLLALLVVFASMRIKSKR